MNDVPKYAAAAAALVLGLAAFALGAAETPQHGPLQSLGGTVQTINGNVATVRLDDNRLINVDMNGNVVTVAQHVTLNGCFEGDSFVLGCRDDDGYPAGTVELNGKILSASSSLVTLDGVPPVIVDVSQAKASHATGGDLLAGRSIVATGYYKNGTFYVTSVR